MMNAEAVLTHVEEGQIPDTWHVFRARKPALFWIGVLSGLSILFLLWICIGVVTAYFLNFPLTTNPLSVSNLIRIALVVSVAVAIVFGILIARKAMRRAKRSLLVVMPDGVVQRIGTSHKSIKTISYAEIVDMKLRTYTASNTAKVIVYIEMQYRDGGTERWVPAPGPADEIAQLVIAGHAQYVALHDSNQVPVLGELSESR
jgi:hypothetical protein